MGEFEVLARLLIIAIWVVPSQGLGPASGNEGGSVWVCLEGYVESLLGSGGSFWPGRGDGEGVTSWDPHHALHPDSTTSLKGANPIHKHLSFGLFAAVKKKN